MAVMMAPAETAEAPVQPKAKTASFATYSDLYEHVLRLVDRLHPADKLHLVEYIIGTVHPLVDDLYEDEEDEEKLAAEAMEALEYARAHPESVMSLEDFEDELKRAEAAGELPR